MASFWASVGSGVIALIALIAAIIAATAAWRTNEHQRKQLDQLTQRDAERHAYSFGMWVTRDLDDFAVFYSNAGSLPVYNVAVRVWVNYGDEAFHFGNWRDIGDLGPTTEPQKLIKFSEDYFQRVVSYAESEAEAKFIDNKGNRDQKVLQIVDYCISSASLEYQFYDSEGQRWERDREGIILREDPVITTKTRARFIALRS
ncbi:hypothetical protein A4R43_36650 [Amycolatopsis albispora]|uniref:Uncharacterized protein n=1 Tax=Amycolatopsis albispora TaxID=1804986 RepID=A0A344LGX7_9PSEU|nr:hypothetical protein A4R43_36650 [Amycolatopsis albispora]